MSVDTNSLLQRMAAAANNKLPGQHLFEEFITQEEEIHLLACIEQCEPPWHLSTFNGAHRWGFLREAWAKGTR